MSDTAPLEALLADEHRCTFAAFGIGDCWTLGGALREQLQAAGHPAVVHVRHGGILAFTTSLPGATADNIAWARRKDRVVVRFGHSSLWVKTMAGPSFHSMFRLPESEYAAVGGAFPILVRGTGMVGTVALSGMPSDVDEHRLLVDTIAGLSE